MISTISDIGLSFNIDKCEFLPFNRTTATSLHCNNTTIPLADCIRRLGISIANNLSSLHQRTVCDISKKIQIGYAKIVANRGKCNKRVRPKLYSNFCNHSVLFASRLFPVPVLKNFRKVYGLSSCPFTSSTPSSEKLATGSSILLQSANSESILLYTITSCWGGASRHPNT